MSARTCAARVLAAIKELNYAPMSAARNLKHGRSQLIALVVADLANPFFARVVWAAEAAVAAWGYSLVVFNSDEKPDNERRILAGSACCPATASCWCRSAIRGGTLQRDADSKPMPTVLFGRTVRRRQGRTPSRSTTSPPAGRRRTICSTSATAASARSPGRSTSPPAKAGSTACWRPCRRAAWRPSRGMCAPASSARNAAYSVARSLLEQPDRPTALYVASGVMALGRDAGDRRLGLRCPADISIASTDTIPGIGGLRPRLTRTEHPLVDMTNEAVRLLVDRIRRGERPSAATSCSSHRWWSATAARRGGATDAPPRLGCPAGLRRMASRRRGCGQPVRRRDLAKVSKATASTMMTPMMICWM